MSGSEIEHLRQMANQIAANFAFHDDQVARIADHLKRFWAPSMRRLLASDIEGGGEGVEQSVKDAMQEISGN